MDNFDATPDIPFSENISKTDLLEQVFIETACTSDWNKMSGNDTVRFCHECKLNVYNIADMTDREAEAVLRKRLYGSRVCAALYRRPDGKLATDNCPRALRKIRNVHRWVMAKVVASIALCMSFLGPAQSQNEIRKETSHPRYKFPPMRYGMVDYSKQNISQFNAIMWGINAASSAPRAATPEERQTHLIHQKYLAQINAQLQTLWKHNKIAAPLPQVKFLINKDGSFSNLTITQSSSDSSKDEKILKALQGVLRFAELPAGSEFPQEVTIEARP